MAQVTQDAFVAGGGFLRLSPCAIVAGSESIIESFGTKQDYVIVSSEKPSFGTQPETEKLELKTTRGKTAQFSRKPKTYSIITGELIPGQNPDAFAVEIAIGYDETKALKTIWENGDPVAAIIGAGIEQDGTLGGFLHIIAYPDGQLDIDNSGEISKVTLNFKGGSQFTADSGVDYTDYNTALTTSLTIAPFGYDSTTDAITISDIATGDFTDLLDGKCVIVDA